MYNSFSMKSSSNVSLVQLQEWLEIEIPKPKSFTMHQKDGILRDKSDKKCAKYVQWKLQNTAEKT